MSGFAEITDRGYRGKTFQEIRDELRTAWKNTFGEGIDLSETSPDGHHVDLEAATVHSLVSLLEAIQANFDRKTATGVWLDRLAAFLALTRAEGESDQSLRKRMDSASVTGLATADGMLTWLQDHVDAGVSLVVNDSPYLDKDGVPGHSFRVSVPEGYSHSDADGNDDTEAWVASQIWHCKPAGIESVGDKEGVCTDASGKSHTMRWITPSEYAFDVKVSVTRYDEETLPDNYVSMIDAAIREWAKGQYTPGKDVIAQRLSVPVYSVPGIENVDVSVAPSGSASYESRIAIPAGKYASVGDVAVSVGGGA